MVTSSVGLFADTPIHISIFLSALKSLRDPDSGAIPATPLIRYRGECVLRDRSRERLQQLIGIVGLEQPLPNAGFGGPHMNVDNAAGQDHRRLRMLLRQPIQELFAGAIG